MSAISGSLRTGWAAMMLSGLGLLAALIAGCAGTAAGPLVSGSLSKGLVSCIMAPNPPAHIARWDAPIGFALDMYFNGTHAPLTVESVSLVDSHNLVLHGALLYEMVHLQHPLPHETAWGRLAGVGQPLPGAVIPAENSTIGKPGPRARNVYQLVLDISARTRAGGWAAGELVKYRAGGHAYTMRQLTGYAISPPPYTAPTFCVPQTNAVEDAWSKLN